MLFRSFILSLSLPFCVSVSLSLSLPFERERKRKRNNHVLFHLFIDSLVDFSTCADQGWNPQPWHIGSMLWSTELPKRGKNLSYLILDIWLYCPFPPWNFSLCYKMAFSWFFSWIASFKSSLTLCMLSKYCSLDLYFSWVNLFYSSSALLVFWCLISIANSVCLKRNFLFLLTELFIPLASTCSSK